MGITTLPNDLRITKSAKIQLYNYRIPNDVLKTKINLSKHTSFVYHSNYDQIEWIQEVIKIFWERNLKDLPY